MKRSTLSHSPSEPRRALARPLAPAPPLQQSTALVVALLCKWERSTTKNWAEKRREMRSQIAWVSVSFLAMCSSRVSFTVLRITYGVDGFPAWAAMYF